MTCSCSNNEVRKEDKEANLPFYQITNEILLREIEMFLDSVPPKRGFRNIDKKIMRISVHLIKDTTKYTFSYPFNATKGAIFFSNVNGNTVAIYFYGLKDFELPDSLNWNYNKEFFPDEYSYYLEYDDYPVPATGGGMEWTLLFHKGKLIKKWKEETQ